MENLKLTANNQCPHVDFNAQTGILELKGQWLPYVDEHYNIITRVQTWLDAYQKTPAEKTVLNVQMDFYSTPASRYLYQIFSQLDKMYTAGIAVTINWYYAEDDDEMYECGLDYQTLLDIPFWIKPL